MSLVSKKKVWVTRRQESLKLSLSIPSSSHLLSFWDCKFIYIVSVIIVELARGLYWGKYWSSSFLQKKKKDETNFFPKETKQGSLITFLLYRLSFLLLSSLCKTLCSRNAKKKSAKSKNSNMTVLRVPTS